MDDMSILQGLCAYNGKLYAAWKGETGDDRIFCSCFNGVSWIPQPLIAGNSSSGPALAVLGNSMFAVWKGKSADERIFFAKLTGSVWSSQSTIPSIASSFGPSLSVFNGSLYAAWKGEAGDQGIYYASSNGAAWSPQAQISNVASSIGPSLASFSGKLYAAWKGQGNDQGIYFAAFNGSNWSPQAQIANVASSVGPSLAAFNGKLYAAWKGESSDQGIYYASFGGASWSSQAQIPNAGSSEGPSLAVFNDKLYAMWKGGNNDQQIFYASFDGTNWSAAAQIPGNTGQDLPVNIGVNMQYQLMKEWCWIAVTTSVSKFYNAASTWTQCSVLTAQLNKTGQVAKPGTCCPSAAQIASISGLAAKLGNLYSPSALYALESLLPPAPGGLVQGCDQSGGVGDALTITGNMNNYVPLSLATITAEIGAGRPVAVDIAWTGPGGGQHCVAIAGVLNDLLFICDPIYGESVMQFELFPAAYQGGATLKSICLTKGA
jgi:hypothetical protein